MKKHHEMFANAIPLIASENVCSPAVREAITTDFAHRYAEGVAGKKVFPCRRTQKNRSGQPDYLRDKPESGQNGK